MDSDWTKFYEISNDGPDFQIPDYVKPADFKKGCAINNCQSYLEKVYIDFKENMDIFSKEQKKQSEKKTILMKIGNKAFRERDYKKALKCYNKAIDVSMDCCVLYTNRAMTYLKLEKPREALIDTKRALYWDPENLKALIYQAHCLYLLGDIIESDYTVAKACQIHPGKVKTIKKMKAEWESS